MKLSRISMLTGACLASLALPGGALAQTPSSDDEIIVTAQKREEAIQDVPLAVQAIGAQDLEAAGVRTVGDLVKFIPGASIVNNTTAGRETISIRGIAAGTTGDGLVGFYIDETPFSIVNLQLSPPGSLIDPALSTAVVRWAETSRLLPANRTRLLFQACSGASTPTRLAAPTTTT